MYYNFENVDTSSWKIYTTYYSGANEAKLEGGMVYFLKVKSNFQHT